MRAGSCATMWLRTVGLQAHKSRPQEAELCSCIRCFDVELLPQPSQGGVVRASGVVLHHLAHHRQLDRGLGDRQPSANRSNGRSRMNDRHEGELHSETRAQSKSGARSPSVGVHHARSGWQGIQGPRRPAHRACRHRDRGQDRKAEVTLSLAEMDRARGSCSNCRASPKQLPEPSNEAWRHCAKRRRRPGSGTGCPLGQTGRRGAGQAGHPLNRPASQ